MRPAPLSQRCFHALGCSAGVGPSSLAFLFVALMSGCASRATVPSASASAANAPQSASRAELEGPADLLTVGSEHIASIHRSKCGSCHAPVGPGSLQHDEAEAAMLRHRRRAKLSERDWADMVDFLSADGRHARHTASVP
jgi:hypothetical protein